MADDTRQPGAIFWLALFILSGLFHESAWSLSVADDKQSQNAGHYEIDPHTSEILILVYRSGMLARLGHNHVISFGNIVGEVVVGTTLSKSSVNMALSVVEAEVDRPESRRAAGDAFTGDVGEKARAKTRKNMLGKGLLFADYFPLITIQSHEIIGSAPNLKLALEIDIKDLRIPLEVDVTMESDSDTLIATGMYQLRQSDLGLQPLSLLMGLLAVKDEMDVIFRINAYRKENFDGNTPPESEGITP